MSEQHKISEYINKMSFKKKLGVGFSPDEVYEAIYDLTNMYNDMLSKTYQEMAELRVKAEQNDTALKQAVPSEAPKSEVKHFVAEPFLPVEEIASVFVPTPQPVTYTEPQAVAAPKYFEEVKPEAKNITFTYQSIPTNIAEAPSLSEDSSPNGKLQHLGKKELLELMLEIRSENERITKQAQDIYDQNQILLEQLKDKRIKINKAGSLAEATFLLNGVYESANVAAQQYLDNLQALYDREKLQTEQKEAISREKAQQILENAASQCESLIKNTRDKCLAIEAESRAACEEMKRRAKAESDAYWKELSERLESFYQSHEGLKALLKNTGQIWGGNNDF